MQRHPGAESNDAGERLLWQRERRVEGDGAALREAADHDAAARDARLLLVTNQRLHCCREDGQSNQRAAHGEVLG